MTDTNSSQFSSLKDKALNQFEELKSQKLSLDMTRGKPGPEQLALSNKLDGILSGNYTSPSKVDCRNYGGLDGLPEAKNLFAPILGVNSENMIIGGNSSLTMMYQFMDFAFHHGVNGKESAWKNIPGGASFLCPVPGYDRHFAICEFLGIRMIPISMTEEGPNLTEIEEHLKTDSTIRGMWCVPKYSNPGGVVYSETNIRELCKLVKIARPEFRVFWDNAYAIHDLEDSAPSLANVFSLSEGSGTQDKFILFGSTSKISFAGAGVAFSGMSRINLSAFQNYLSFQTIGPDKVNQLRHIVMFKTADGLIEHMHGHRKLLKPRFETVLNELEGNLGSSNLASWTKPKGGYFISVDTLPGIASETIRLAAELGVKITPAGSTFPHGKDPLDSNIRLAPSFPSIEELRIASRAFATALIIAAARKNI